LFAAAHSAHEAAKYLTTPIPDLAILRYLREWLHSEAESMAAPERFAERSDSFPLHARTGLFVSNDRIAGPHPAPHPRTHAYALPFSNSAATS
jgi:hypothetical protein